MTASRQRAERAERARARASWPIKRFRVGSEPDDDLTAFTTPEERLAMMWELALQAWTLSGRAWPDYERHEVPGALVRASRP